MKVAYIDPIAGLAGDMLLAALVDAGLARSFVGEVVEALGLRKVDASLRRVRRGVIKAAQLKISFSDQEPDRRLSDIKSMISGSSLSDRVKSRAIDVFTKLAAAEAKVHGEPLSKVHFHEVGAVDALVDVVGTVLALERLGVERLHCGELPLGSGSVSCAHGLLPVPAPATMELVRGLPVRINDGSPGERVTPTGAALARTLVDSFGPPPVMVPEKVGYGAGSRIDLGLPNIVRVVIGEALAEPGAEASVVIETNVDDMNPQLCEALSQRLFTAGAQDVFYAPVTMKKGRPGIWIQVVCSEDIATRAREILFRETTTLGMRSHRVERAVLRREIVEVATGYGRLRVKLGISPDGEVLNVHPEFSDCLAAAERRGVPVKVVMQAALTAFHTSDRPAGAAKRGRSKRRG